LQEELELGLWWGLKAYGLMRAASEVELVILELELGVGPTLWSLR
jgi:hypothetical protein